jgi:hypothetical protein
VLRHLSVIAQFKPLARTNETMVRLAGFHGGMLIVAFVSGGRLLCAHQNLSLRAEATAERWRAQAGLITAVLAASTVDLLPPNAPD